MPGTQSKIYKSTSDLDAEEIRSIYNEFNSPIAESDCGRKRAPHNPSGKPFCCDICHAVPAAYKREWSYLEASTYLWHKWCGNEMGNPIWSVRGVSDYGLRMEVVCHTLDFINSMTHCFSL